MNYPKTSLHVQLSLSINKLLTFYSILFYPITLEGRQGTTDEFATISFHLALFSAALVELAKSIPVHSLILSSHLFFCLPLFLFPFTVPCRIVFAKPEDLETWPNHLSFRFLTRIRSSSYSPMAAWIFLRTSSLVTWSLYDGWLVGCFGFNGPLRQYFSLYRAVSQREGERGEKG